MAALKMKGHEMTEVKSQRDNKNMEHTPSGFISQKVSDHALPPEDMTGNIDCGYSRQVYDPPSCPQKTYFSRKSLLCHITPP